MYHAVVVLVAGAGGLQIRWPIGWIEWRLVVQQIGQQTYEDILHKEHTDPN